MPVLRLLKYAALAAVGAAAAASAEPSFVPVFRDNFPDAFVVQSGGEFIAYSTNEGANVPMLTSRDLVHWSRIPGDAMPELGAWAKRGFTWAPEVIQLGSKWLLYYTASARKENAQCVGVAVADSARGPFRDASPRPLVCQTALGGTIDASPFKDADGKLYLYFKNDGNRVHQGTFLWGQQLSPDGLSLVGSPVQLLDDKAKWKERVIEAPTMVRSPAGYELFYSAGFFGWNENETRLSPYSMGYANCSGPLGPCKDAADNPILHSFNEREAGCLSGPGHQSIFTVGQRTFLSFHAWAANSGCHKLEDERYLYIAPLFWRDGKPQIGPSLRETAGEKG